MNDDSQLHFFDPNRCLKTARWSLMSCVALLALEALVLAIVDPQRGSCSNWIIYQGKPSEAPVWLLMLLFTVVPTAWLCFIVLRWQKFCKRILDAMLDKPDQIVQVNLLWIVVCVLWTLFCSIPLLVALSECTILARRIGL
jgi:hypothetical protein